MVTYTTIPYFLTQKLGKIQDEILTKACAHINSIDEINLDNFKKTLESELKPIIEINKIDLRTDPLVVKMKRFHS
jgi:hypothetical protein